MCGAAIFGAKRKRFVGEDEASGADLTAVRRQIVRRGMRPVEASAGGPAPSTRLSLNLFALG